MHTLTKKDIPLLLMWAVFMATAARTSSSHMTNVRKKIYDVASHLYLINNKGIIPMM